MNFRFHIFWMNEYFHYNIGINTYTKKKKITASILHFTPDYVGNGLRTVRRQFLNEVRNMF